MDSSEFANHLQVGKDMMRIAEGAEAAADHDIQGAERADAIERHAIFRNPRQESFSNTRKAAIALFANSRRRK